MVIHFEKTILTSLHLHKQPTLWTQEKTTFFKQHVQVLESHYYQNKNGYLVQGCIHHHTCRCSCFLCCCICVHSHHFCQHIHPHLQKVLPTSFDIASASLAKYIKTTTIRDIPERRLSLKHMFDSLTSALIRNGI